MYPYVHTYMHIHT